MEGTVLAVLISVFVWGLSYLATFYLLAYFLSAGLMPRKLREKSTPISVGIIFASVAVASVLITGFIYRVGGEMEAGNGVAWGCYVEDFQLLVTMCWITGGLLTFGLMVASLIDPKMVNFPNRLNPVLLFLAQATVSILIAKISSWCIPLLASNLAGLDASCL
jgi:hypothetical protein